MMSTAIIGISSARPELELPKQKGDSKAEKVYAGGVDQSRDVRVTRGGRDAIAESEKPTTLLPAIREQAALCVIIILKASHPVVNYRPANDVASVYRAGFRFDESYTLRFLRKCEESRSDRQHEARH